MTDQRGTQEDLDESIGGVQGGEDAGEATPAGAPAQTTPPGETPDAPAPDGAEIEWAGGLVKKPPVPQG